MDPMTHRRDFVRSLALGASAGVLARPGTAPAVEPDPENDQDRPKAPPTEVDARMDLLLARFGDHLDADARKTVRAEVEAIVLRAEALRSLPLDNGDAPMPLFVPYRGPLT